MELHLMTERLEATVPKESPFPLAHASIANG